MRKQFAATVRTVQVPKVQPKIRRLSLEEEALILDQANKDARDVENGMAEVHRQIEISEALEDLAAVAQTIRQASPVELDLIEAAAQMAVAGTDNEPELVLPAMEGFQEGKHVAFESFSEKAMMLWKNIQEFLKKIWNKIIAYFRVNVVAQQLEQRLQELLQKLQAAGHAKNGTGKSAQAERVSSTLIYKGKSVTNAAALTQALAATVRMAQFIYVANPDYVAKRAEIVTNTLNAFDLKTARKQIGDMVRMMNAVPVPAVPGGDAESTSDDFLGGGRIVAKINKDDPHSVNHMAVLERLQASGVTYEHGEGVHGEMEFQLPGTPEAIKMVQTAIALIRTVITFHKSNTGLPKLEAESEKLKAASAKATAVVSRMKPAPGFEESHNDIMSMYRGAVNFNHTYARWVQQPAMPFYGNVMRIARAVLMIAGETLAASNGAHPKDAEDVFAGNKQF